MAEAWLRHLAGDAIRASSAGTRPATLHPMSVRAMAEVGVDLGGQRAKGLSDVDLASVTQVVTVCDGAAAECPALLQDLPHRHWPVPDPASIAREFPHLVSDGFRAVRDNLKDRVTLLVRELTAVSDGQMRKIV